jgi:hypothetical protein
MPLSKVRPKQPFQIHRGFPCRQRALNQAYLLPAVFADLWSAAVGEQTSLLLCFQQVVSELLELLGSEGDPPDHGNSLLEPLVEVIEREGGNIQEDGLRGRLRGSERLGERDG